MNFQVSTGFCLNPSQGYGLKNTKNLVDFQALYSDWLKQSSITYYFIYLERSVSARINDDISLQTSFSLSKISSFPDCSLVQKDIPGTISRKG